MKTIELTTIAQSVEDLLDLASAEEEVLLRLPNGKVFLLASVADAPTDDDDFVDEVARTRQNAALYQSAFQCITLQAGLAHSSAIQDYMLERDLVLERRWQSRNDAPHSSGMIISRK